jgi:hypothetical protein
MQIGHPEPGDDDHQQGDGQQDMPALVMRFSGLFFCCGHEIRVCSSKIAGLPETFSSQRLQDGIAILRY